MDGIPSKNVDILKDILSCMVELFEWGVLFLQTDMEKIVWRASSTNLEIPQLGEGQPITEEAPLECMQTGLYVKREVPRLKYGIRLDMYAQPITDGDNIIGSLVAAIPKAHPISRAFEHIAPVVAQFFPEGVTLVMTDLEKYTRKVDSEKFSFDGLPLGQVFRKDDVALRALETNQISRADYPAEVYGIPIRIVASPLIDPEDPSRALGNFIMCMPRTLPNDLNRMSGCLKRSLNEIAQTVDQLAKSAREIEERELLLNARIEEVYQLSERMNEVIGMLKKVADKTRLSSVNSAIETVISVDRGFGALAREIRKLSDESKQITRGVTTFTESIQNTVNETKINSQLTLQASQEQAQATHEINTRITGLANTAEKLDKIAKGF